MKAISLFACGGIGDLALRHSGFDVVVANELLADRAEVFKFNFPETQMIVGDIAEKQQEIVAATSKSLVGQPLDVVFATPPCQGMSKNGRGKLLNAVRKGDKAGTDPRNLLIIPTVAIFLATGAHTLVMENVPEMESTYIPHPYEEGVSVNIIEFIRQTLGEKFSSSVRVVEFADYGVPQCRQRLISIFTRHDTLKSRLQQFGSLLPLRTYSKTGDGLPGWQTVRNAIAHLPVLDAGEPGTAKHPLIPYHTVPLLDAEKYFWVSNTPREKTAFDNQCVNPACLFDKNPTHGASKDDKGVNRFNTDTPVYCVKCGELLPRPWVKEAGGYRIMKGYTSAYKRMGWDSPCSTLTRNLSYACSDNKLHPEQNRVLSLYEAMILHTITHYPYYWQRADGKKVSDKLIRELIGESIPPAGLAQIFGHLAQLLRDAAPEFAQPELGQQALCFS